MILTFKKRSYITQNSKTGKGKQLDVYETTELIHFCKKDSQKNLYSFIDIIMTSFFAQSLKIFQFYGTEIACIWALI